MLALLTGFMLAAQSPSVAVLQFRTLQKLHKPGKTSAPIIVSIKANGDVFIADNQVPFGELAGKLSVIAANRKGGSDVFVRADKGLPYGTLMKVIGRIRASGFDQVLLITEVEDGG